MMTTDKPFSMTDLHFDYPESLVGLKPQSPARVLWSEPGVTSEISIKDLLRKIPSGDVVVLNDTQVLKRRVFAGNLEILFLNSDQERVCWEVLFPSRDLKVGDEIQLPEGVRMTLLQKGRPQKITTDRPLVEAYFEKWAELPLPPYIQKARGERHNLNQDMEWYQTAWAQKPGSLAAPTASLHFSENDINQLRNQDVQIEKLTLHVGLGTFLPLSDENFVKRELHEERIEIAVPTWDRLLKARQEGRKIWALGTTVTRSLEACARGHLSRSGDRLEGTTKLFIHPGDEFKMVDRLMTNFHQPGSSLLALVMAFAGIGRVQAHYRWAINKQFKLFSYGDFSVWTR